tara:strand:- start:59 stop:1087 length:1029 start_codon:yes stop_codon:yes gene_type:complete
MTSSGNFVGPTLKPTAFGLSGTYRNISAYKKAVIDAIDNRINEFNAVHSDYAPYLKFLVEDASGTKPFPNVRNLLSVLKATRAPDSPNSIAEIKKYFAEVVGPIAIVEDKSLKGKTGFDSSASVGVPVSVSQSGYDFELGGTEVTVKMPKGKTNTLKPGDIVRNPDLKVRKRFFDLVKSTPSLLFLYELFEVLEENTPKEGAYKLIYGTDGRNGKLNALIGNKPDQDAVLIPSNRASIPENIISMYANALEKQIEIWSKSNGIAKDLLEFTNLYYNTKKLFAFSYDIKTGTGRGVPSFKDSVKDAYIMGKYRAGPFGADAQGNMTTNPTRVQPEKLGIQMTF